MKEVIALILFGITIYCNYKVNNIKHKQEKFYDKENLKDNKITEPPLRIIKGG